MVGGVALPAIGVVRAFRSGKQLLDDIPRKRARAEELVEQSAAAVAAYQSDTPDPTNEGMNAIAIDYNNRMEAEGIIPPTWANAGRLHEGEIDRLASEFASANVPNALTAAAGLILGLVGGIVSLFPPT